MAAAAVVAVVAVVAVDAARRARRQHVHQRLAPRAVLRWQLVLLAWSSRALQATPHQWRREAAALRTMMRVPPRLWSSVALASVALAAAAAARAATSRSSHPAGW
jgi:hypothetical protein